MHNMYKIINSTTSILISPYSKFEVKLNMAFAKAVAQHQQFKTQTYGVTSIHEERNSSNLLR